MRIGDWSSDVCSSDLPRVRNPQLLPQLTDRVRTRPGRRADRRRRTPLHRLSRRLLDAELRPQRSRQEAGSGDRKSTRLKLQSLMRNSHDDSCLKKKTTTTDNKTNQKNTNTQIPIKQ